MEIRTFVAADTEALVSLWRAVGLVRPVNDPHRDIERKVADSPWGLLVAVDDAPGSTDDQDGAAIVGSVMVGYDGHRGWINYLATHPDHRRRGIARNGLDRDRRQPARAHQGARLTRRIRFDDAALGLAGVGQRFITKGRHLSGPGLVGS